MIRNQTIRASATFAAVWATLLLAAPAAGQVGTSSSHRSVRVAVPDSFPAPAARALVVRFATGSDLILLNRAHATADALLAAVTLLNELRRTTPRVANTQVVTIQGFAQASGANDRSLVRLRSVMERLQRKPMARIGNLGRGRWVELGDAGFARTRS